MTDVQKAEHEAWRELCRRLLELGAVHDTELMMPSNMPPHTPGLALLDNIRRWAALRSQLGEAMSRNMDGDCSPCGFRIFTQAWGMVGSDHAAFVAIQPHYVWRGK